MKHLGPIVLLLMVGCTSWCPCDSTSPPLTSGWEELVSGNPIPDGVNIHRIPVSKEADESHTIVQIRDREKLHVHDRHDLEVHMLQGQGILILGDEKIACEPGSVLNIPRGVPHAFINTGSEPAAAYAIFRPGFDGKDTRPVESTQP